MPASPPQKKDQRNSSAMKKILAGAPLTARRTKPQSVQGEKQRQGTQMSDVLQGKGGDAQAPLYATLTGATGGSGTYPKKTWGGESSNHPFTPVPHKKIPSSQLSSAGVKEALQPGSNETPPAYKRMTGTGGTPDPVSQNFQAFGASHSKVVETAGQRKQLNIPSTDKTVQQAGVKKLGHTR